jgi:putative oxidoreductase
MTAIKGKAMVQLLHQAFGSRILRVILTIIFAIAAGMKFAAVPFEVAGFERFGYPLWFMYVIGALQLLGAALLCVRGFNAAGATLLAILMAGAVGSHWRVGDPVAMTFPPLVLLLLLAGITYARRAEFAAIPMRNAERSCRSHSR